MSRLHAVFLQFLLITAAHATDLLVAPGASAPMYPSISSALTAAIAGDRIIIQPAVYSGDVVITRSVELLSNVAGQRYSITGDVVFAPITASQSVLIQDAVVQDSIRSGTVTGAGHTLRSANCKATTYFVLNAAVSNQLYRDSIMGYAGMYAPSDIIGCVIAGSPGLNGLGINIFTQGVVNNAAYTRIIGNVIGSGRDYPNSALFVSTFAPFVIENNYITLTCPNNVNFTGAIRTGDSFNAGQVTTTACTIRNNTIRWSGPGTINGIYIEESDPLFVVDVRNNFYVGAVVTFNNSPNATQQYNITTSNAAHVNTSTGAPTVGSPAINAGDPDVIYTDLDLSRNDAGCYGASFTRDQFDDALPTTAFVGFVDTPRRTQAALAIPITAIAIDR